MRNFAIIILLVISFYGFSQTNETDCTFPSNEILPEKFKDCDAFRKYFEENTILERDSSGFGYFFVSCNLYSNGKLSGIKQNFLLRDSYPRSNANLMQRITKIDNWEVSSLKKNEYYALNFMLYSKAEELEVKLKWKIKNYVELDKSTFNYTDNNGLRQGQWIKYDTDTIIERSQSITIIEYDKPETEKIPEITIDTLICKHVYSTGYYTENKKHGKWLIYNTENSKSVNRKDTINFGPLLYSAEFSNDSLTGKLTTYYSFGKVKSEIEFKNGNANGNINCYFESGKLKYSGYMVFGKEFFNGSEYSEKGYKLKDRKFNYNQVLEDWTDLDNLLLRIVLN